MAERFKYLKPVGAIAAAAAFTFGPTAIDTAVSISSENSDSGNHITQERSFLDQFDEFAQSDYGKLITHTALIYAALSAVYAFQKGREIDDNRKFKERMTASAAMVALTINLAAQSYTESDPLLTAGMLSTYVLAQSAYNYESIVQADRSWKKRLPGYASIFSLLLINGAILAETIDKY